jgi:hypothetical protein
VFFFEDRSYRCLYFRLYLFLGKSHFMATAMERFDQVVVGGAARSSEVMVFFLLFALGFFFFALTDGDQDLSQQKHLRGFF